MKIGLTTKPWAAQGERGLGHDCITHALRVSLHGTTDETSGQSFTDSRSAVESPEGEEGGSEIHMHKVFIQPIAWRTCYAMPLSV